VNTINDTILFAAPHNFHSGDGLLYTKLGTGGTSVGGIETAGVVFYAVVLDERTIRLVATKDQATNPNTWLKKFSVANVSGSTITLGGHGFVEGQAVTYAAPKPLDFNSAQVDVIGWQGGTNYSLADSPNAENLFFVGPDGPLAHGLNTGDLVLYRATSSDPVDPATLIGGLADGGIYRVVKVDAYTIKLKYTNPVTASVNFVRSASGDQIVRTDTVDWRADGYAAGQTLLVTVGGTQSIYKIAAVTASTITLCASACGAGITAAANHVTQTTITGSVEFIRGANANTNDIIRRTAGWANTNFVAGATITVTGSSVAANNGSWTIASISANGQDLVLTAKQQVTSATGSVTVSRPVSADFDEPFIPLAPVKSATVIPIGATVFAGAVGEDGRMTITRSDSTWAFSAGQKITVANTVSNDGTYIVHSVSGGVLTLKNAADLPLATRQYAAVGTAETVTGVLVAGVRTGARISLAHNPVSDAHSLINVTQLPLALTTGGTLVDGRTYYVRNPTATTFELSETEAGAVLTFEKVARNGTANILVNGQTVALDGAAQHGFSAVVDLTSAGTLGQEQELRIDLTGTTAVPAGQMLLGPGGASLAVNARPVGDGISSATSTGSGGGAIASGTNRANVNASYNVDTYIASSLASAGGDIKVIGWSQTRTTTSAKNNTGGIVGIGHADSTTEQDNFNDAYIGAGARLVAGGNLVVRAITISEADGSSRARAAGGIGLADAEDTKIHLDYAGKAYLGAGADVLVGGAAVIDAVSSVLLDSNSYASGLGFGADGESRARTEVGSASNPSVNEASLGANASLFATSVSITARLANISGCARSQDWGCSATNDRLFRALRAISHSESYGAGFYSEGNDEAYTEVFIDSRVTISTGVQLTGLEGVDLIATFEGTMRTDADSFARSTGLFGYVDADANSTVRLRSSVNSGAGDPRTRITAGPRDTANGFLRHPGTTRLALYVSATQGSVSHSVNGHVSKRSLAAGGGDEHGDRLQQSGTVDISSDVTILSGRSPYLEIGALGELVKAVGVTYTSSDTAITVDDIVNPGPGKVLITATTGAAHINGTGGTWTFSDTLSKVTIINRSAKDLVLRNITVANSAVPEVHLTTVGAGATGLRFAIERAAAPTLVRVLNTSSSSIKFNGTIENPIGTTSILNEGGSVVSNLADRFTGDGTTATRRPAAAPTRPPTVVATRSSARTSWTSARPTAASGPRARGSTSRTRRRRAPSRRPRRTRAQ
jgi:hypothetical protein